MNAAQRLSRWKVCWQKHFCFAGWKCCRFIYKAILMWVKAVQDVVVLPSQKIISKSLVYLLMFLSS